MLGEAAGGIPLSCCRAGCGSVADGVDDCVWAFEARDPRSIRRSWSNCSSIDAILVSNSGCRRRVSFACASFCRSRSTALTAVPSSSWAALQAPGSRSMSSRASAISKACLRRWSSQS